MITFLFLFVTVYLLGSVSQRIDSWIGHYENELIFLAFFEVFVELVYAVYILYGMELNGWMLALSIYLHLGLIAGLVFIGGCIIGDLRGNVDHKFGPAWKSSMTYLMATSQMVPIINLFWVWVTLISFKQSLTKKQALSKPSA